MNDLILLHPNDNVAVALRPMIKGESAFFMLDGKEHAIELLDDIPKGHKLAVTMIHEEGHIHKFGYSIGVAIRPISAGTWVHSHNLKTGLGERMEYNYDPPPAAPSPQNSLSEATFKGYLREDGEIGIRNEIWILNTVGCINKTCELLAKMANKQFRGRGIDGVYHFAHPYGCSQLGDDLKATQRLLAALARHGNAAGVLIVGLGCENNQIEEFKRVIGDVSAGRIQFMKSQDVGDEIETGLDLISELVMYAERFTRMELPLSRLRIGLKCGGSDGLSGITANPLTGRIADIMTTQHGGTALMSEVPEMFGAETILMNRAQDEQVFHQIIQLVNDFKDYFVRHDQPIYENPSPGNKDGGITTLEEKSLGCTQKGGQAIVSDVLLYGDRSKKNGLNLVQAPGNDLVSVTALSAAGAHLVLFTTGRGTPFGGPVPTVKIATNTELSSRKKHWIDFNAGALLEGRSMEDLQEELMNYIIGLASGDIKTNNENNGFREIAIFKDGVIL